MDLTSFACTFLQQENSPMSFAISPVLAPTSREYKLLICRTYLFPLTLRAYRLCHAHSPRHMARSVGDLICAGRTVVVFQHTTLSARHVASVSPEAYTTVLAASIQTACGTVVRREKAECRPLGLVPRPSRPPDLLKALVGIRKDLLLSTHAQSFPGHHP